MYVTLKMIKSNYQILYPKYTEDMEKYFWHIHYAFAVARYILSTFKGVKYVHESLTSICATTATLTTWTILF